MCLSLFKRVDSQCVKSMFVLEPPPLRFAYVGTLPSISLVDGISHQVLGLMQKH